MLKARQFDDAETAAIYRARLDAAGFDRDRVDLLHSLDGTADHLAQYGRVDIALDPFPYNGTTTTCEALWMGVPVVTLRGARHASRVGASLLTQVDLRELIADDADAYVGIAVGLAGDLDRLRALRAELRARVSASPLRDETGFARDVETAYREMWRRFCGA